MCDQVFPLKMKFGS